MTVLEEASAAPFKWKWRLREWQRESLEDSIRGPEVLIDPLTTGTRAKAVSKKASVAHSPAGDPGDFVDPLGATKEDNEEATCVNGITPEAEAKKGPVLVNTLASDYQEVLAKETLLPGFEPWSSQRKRILEQFMAAEKLSIKTDFLPNGIPLETHLSTVNRQTQRVQQFEDTSGQKKFENLSQKEYVRALNELRRNLLFSWAHGKRVESIAIITDLARILASTSSPQFYPSQFVLVTDILDIFGELVFERLLWKANKELHEAGLEPLTTNFKVSDVPQATRDTAKNWFCKIGVVTELLPRFYVEASVIGCLRFLDPDAIPANIVRLCEMPNRMQQSLVATYARAYICRVAMRLYPNDRAPHWKCLNDWMSLSAAIPQTQLLTPALEWMMQCAAYNAISYEDMLPVWNYCRISEKRDMLFKPFISSVTPKYLCEHSVEFCKLILQDDRDAVEGLILFGEQLLKDETPETSRRPLIRSVWQKITKLTDTDGFIECTVKWIGFAALYFPLSTVDVMISGVIKRLAAEKQHEKYHSALMRLVELLVQNRTDLIELMSMDHFTQLLDLVHEESSRAKCSEMVLSAFIREHRVGCCDNFRVAYQVLVLCKRLHDSLSVSSEERERRTVTNLVERSLDRFDLIAEPERALNFFVDTRAALSNIDDVVAYLVSRICSLGFSVVRMGRVSRTGASFLRACVANMFITIASLIDPVQRLYLYLQCCMLGLMANSLPQVDATVRCCIELLAACPNVPPAKYRAIASAFLAFLVVVPDSPSKQPLYAFSAFLNAIARYSWNNSHLEHGRLLIQCLHYLAAMRLQVLPYHIGSVQSNDAIYGSSAEFLEVVRNKEEIVMERLEEILRPTNFKSHSLSMELLELVLSVGSLDKLAPLIVELYEQCLDKRELLSRRRNVREEIQRRAVGGSGPLRRALTVINEMDSSILKTDAP